MRNQVRKANGYKTILIATTFVLLTTTACGNQEQWLYCQESRGWEDPKTQNTFHLSIKRSEEQILGQYIDQRNTSPAAIKENPVTLVATTNIKRPPGQNGIVQVTYTINKENLKFSKITRNWISNRSGKPENLGGITISEAGFCKSGRKPLSNL